MRIPFSRATLDYTAAEPYLREAIDNGWLTTGPLVARLTESLQTFLGTKNLVCVSSCTAALQIALTACDMQPGDEVIVPANTFIATYETVVLGGFTPVITDIDANTWNISPEKIAKRISPRTRAIIAVPFAGNPLDMPRLRKLADTHGLKLILDNAHALETRYNGRFLHEWADFSCYSFYATKNLTTAEGGAIVCNEEQIERVRALSLHGMSRAAWSRYSGGSWRYDIVEIGYKANLTDIHAALGLAQMPALTANLEKRRMLVDLYRDRLSGLPLRWQQIPDGAHKTDSAHHLFCISIDSGTGVEREQLMTAFTAKSIGYSVHFIPLYEFTAVALRGQVIAGDFVNTAAYFAGALSLPLYPLLNVGEVEEICEIIRSAFADSAATTGT
jgi:dTDP-4-amino-4,6-dideoxygalactose transaminase